MGFFSHARSQLGRLALLGLMLLAVLGPWMYSEDGAPPPEWCRDPNVLLANGRCVRLAPGTELLSFLGSLLLAFPTALASGVRVLPSRAEEVAVLLGLILVWLPLLTTALLLWRQGRRLRMIHLAGCGLAALVGLWLTRVASDPALFWPWGLWLYIAAALAAVALEALAARAPHSRPAG